MVDLWVWDDFWHPYRWPWVKVTKLPKRDAIYLVPTMEWEPLIQSLQNWVGISRSSCLSPDYIKEKFCHCFSVVLRKPVENSIYHIFEMVDPIDMKQKEN